MGDLRIYVTSKVHRPWHHAGFDGPAREVAELRRQRGRAKSFAASRMAEVKCFCCSNDHRHPRTGEKLPCDRVLVLGMLQRWFDDVEDGESYLESFNSPWTGSRARHLESSGLVRELSGSLGGLSAPVSQAVWAASAMTLPWLIVARLSFKA